MPRLIARFLALSLVGGALAACGSPVARPTPLPSTTTAYAEPRTRIDVASVWLGPWRAQQDGEARHVVLGSLRATIRGERVDWADDRFLHAIVHAARVPNGWVFVASDGVVARSPTFLGQLERLGEIPNAWETFRNEFMGWTGVWPAPPVIGRAVIVHEGAVWTTDGTTPIARLTNVERVIGARFLDARIGLVVVDGGRALRTEDGGAHWAPVDLGRDAATNVSVRDGRFVVATASGEMRSVARDGSLGTTPAVVVRGAFSERMPDVVTDFEAHPVLLAALVARSPALAERFGVRLGDGTRVTGWDRDLFVADPSGHVSRHADVLPRLGCGLIGWGVALGIACDGEWYRTTDYRRLERMPDLAPGIITPMLSNDGRHAAAATMVLRAPDGAWTEMPAAVRDRTLVLHGVHGDRVLASMLSSPTDREDRTVVISIDSGRIVPLRAPDGGRVPYVEEQNASFASDGTIVVVVPTETADSAILIGRGDAPMSRFALPTGARDVAFADADRGIAYGASMAELWRTRNGGLDWELLHIALDGGARGLALASRRRAATCDDDGCTIPGVLRMNGWVGPARNGRMLTAQGARVGTGAQPPNDPTHERRRSATQFRCTADASRAVRTPMRSSAPSSAHVEWSVSGDAAARIAQWDGASARHMIEIAWRGRDAEGTYVATTGPTEALVPTGSTPSETLTLRIGAATRRAALFRYGPNGATGLVVARAGAGIVVPELPSGAHVDDRDPHSLLATPTGELAVHFDRGVTDLVVVLDADGRVRTHRSFAWYAPRARVLALRGSEVGLAVEEPGPSFRFIGIENGDASPALPFRDTGAVPACRATPEPTAVHLFDGWWTVGRMTNPDDVQEHESFAAPRATIALGTSGACLESAASGWAAFMTVGGEDGGLSLFPESAMRLRAGPDGSLVGEADDGRRRRAVRCTPATD